MIALLLIALVVGEPASVAIESDRREYFLGESIPVRVRIEFDARFFRENAVPLTLRKTDVPMLLESPWLRGLEAGPGDATLGVNDDVVAALRVAASGEFDGLILDRTLRPQKAGDLELAAPVLRFAHATRFDEDALGTRVAMDRVESSVKGAPLVIRILPLPTEGRPPGFSGGVGRFSITASADATEVEAGKSLNLVLIVTGDGDLSAIAPPRLDGLAGFHVYGRLDGGDSAKKTFTYEISPLSAEVMEIPSIPLDYFDPAPPAGYRVARTAAIPLRVRPGPAAPPPPAAEGGKGPAPGLLAIAVAVAITAALLLGRRLRRRSPPESGSGP